MVVGCALMVAVFLLVFFMAHEYSSHTSFVDGCMGRRLQIKAIQDAWQSRPPNRDHYYDKMKLSSVGEPRIIVYKGHPVRTRRRFV